MDGPKYAYVAGPNNARALFEYFAPTKDEVWQYGTDYWANIEGGALSAVVNYAYPLARTRRITPFGEMPSRRTVYARAIWNYAPASPHIAHAPLGNGKFIDDTLTLKIDIIAQN
jgi:hypothetical protein